MSVKPEARLSCLLAAAAATTIGLAACSSSGSDPVGLPSLSPSATASSPSPSPSPTATSKKAELAAATAVVKRYYEIANQLKIHMNADGLAALMTAGCPCRAQVRAVRRAARHGEHYIDHAHINEFVPSYEAPGAVFVLVDLNASRGGLSTASGHMVTSAPPAKHVKRVFRLIKVQDRWLIGRIEALT
jgi:hypothetical protein